MGRRAHRVESVEDPRPLHELFADLERIEGETRESMARLKEMLGDLLLPPGAREAAVAPAPRPIDGLDAAQRITTAMAEGTDVSLQLSLALFAAPSAPSARRAAARRTTTRTEEPDPMPVPAARAKRLSREALLVLDAVTCEGNLARIPLATAPALSDLAPAFKNGDRLERKLYEQFRDGLPLVEEGVDERMLVLQRLVAETRAA